MHRATRRRHAAARHTCRCCGSRAARFQYRGQVRADKDHTLCFQCYRAEVNRQRARRLADVVTPAPLKMRVEDAWLAIAN